MIFEKSVVKIVVKYRKHDFNHPHNIFNIAQSSGSGVFITNNLILTCHHVIKSALDIEIIYNKTVNINATVKYIFPDDDLAIIKIDTPLLDVKIIDFEMINNKQLGEVYTIGFPLSSDNIIVTKGIISGFQNSLIQTDASLNPGNSGGPLIIKYDEDNYKIIGINVSKMSGNAENTGFVVPIYRFKIIWDKIKESLSHDLQIIKKKPIWYFDFQKIQQPKLRQIIFGQFKKLPSFGIRVSLLNKSYYISKYFNENDILLSINSNKIDSNGYIKFDFYPEKILIDEIGLWFNEGDLITMHVFNSVTNVIEEKKIILEITKTNIFDYYDVKEQPTYYVENNGLILSILSKQHLNAVKELELTGAQLLKIFDRNIYQRDLFTVYLSDLNYSKVIFTKYPIGEIIIEINDNKFNNYDEFIKLIDVPITKIKTIENEIYYVE
jgi:hypothetical protein